MKLYQLEDGTLINLEQMTAIVPAAVLETGAEWEIRLSDGCAYSLTDDDARNLMDKDFLDFEFMAE